MSRIFITTISILFSVKLFAMHNIDMVQLDDEQNLKQQTLIPATVSEDRVDNNLSLQDNIQIYQNIQKNEKNNTNSVVQEELEAQRTLIFDMVCAISRKIDSLSDAIGVNNAYMNSITEEQLNSNSSFLVDMIGTISMKIDSLSDAIAVNVAQNNVQTLNVNNDVEPAIAPENNVQIISVNEPAMNSNLKGVKEDLEGVGATGKEFIGKGKDFFAAISNFFNNLCCKKKATEESIKNDISKLENKAATGKLLLENFQRSQIIE